MRASALMPLTQAQEDLEHDLRVEQMATNIEKMRADLKREAARYDRDGAWENWKFAVSCALAAAALVGAGVGLGNLIWAHPTPPAPIIIQQVPAPAAH